MFVAGLVLGYFGGAWLDRKLGTAPWAMVSGLGLGAAVGFREVWRIVSRLQALERSQREAAVRRRRAALDEEPGLEGEAARLDHGRSRGAEAAGKKAED